MQSNLTKLERSEEAPLVEPIAIVDVFVTGGGRIEEVAPNIYRLVLVVDQRTAFDNSLERVVVSRICTGETLAALGMAAAAATKAPELLDRMVPATALAN